jgi:hypothetical protein
MNYMTAFDGKEVWSVTFNEAMACAVALAKSFQHVVIYHGVTVKWEYKNT